jgi:hypothetical protein
MVKLQACKIDPLKGNYTMWREEVLGFVPSLVSLVSSQVVSLIFLSFLGKGKYFIQAILDLVGEVCFPLGIPSCRALVLIPYLIDKRLFYPRVLIS